MTQTFPLVWYKKKFNTSQPTSRKHKLEESGISNVGQAIAIIDLGWGKGNITEQKAVRTNYLKQKEVKQTNHLNQDLLRAKAETG